MPHTRRHQILGYLVSGVLGVLLGVGLTRMLGPGAAAADTELAPGLVLDGKPYTMRRLMVERAVADAGLALVVLNRIQAGDTNHARMQLELSMGGAVSILASMREDFFEFNKNPTKLINSLEDYLRSNRLEPPILDQRIRSDIAGLQSASMPKKSN